MAVFAKTVSTILLLPYQTKKSMNNPVTLIAHLL